MKQSKKSDENPEKPGDHHDHARHAVYLIMKRLGIPITRENFQKEYRLRSGARGDQS